MNIEEPVKTPESNTSSTPVRKRGGCLTALLIAMLIMNPLAAMYYFLNGSQVSLAFPNMPAFVIPLLGVIGLVNMGLAFGIWEWKKWGVYGFIASAVINFGINAMYVNLPSAFSGLVGVVILVVLIRPFWKKMD